MPVAYTNRKGHTYYLCQGMTKTGKLRYNFTREPRDEVPDQIPEGYRISESVNGAVSLVKDRPQLILPQEVASVEAALDRHPKGRDYRVAVKQNQIVIYERLGSDVETLNDMFGEFSPLPPEILKRRIQELVDKMARYSPILRFILVDPEERNFIAERRSYFSDVVDWVTTGDLGRLDKLARRLIHRLGTDDFFKVL